MTFHARCAAYVVLFGCLLACSSQPSSGAQGPGTASTSCSGGATDPCAVDDTVTCVNNAAGYSCRCGVTPETQDPTLTCTAPTPGADGEQDFCCTSK